jgi:hypothetical protein
MRSHRPVWLAALTAALVAALALAVVPAAQGTGKGAATGSDVLLHDGATTVALDPGAAAALESLGVKVAPVRPAYAGKSGIAFPITLGLVSSDTLAGQIRHVGGLRLSKGDTKVYLTRFFVEVDDDPSLSGLVGVGHKGGDRAELFSLDLSRLKVEPGKGSIELSGITLKLTAGAAAALNGAFGTAAFTEGLVMGTATVAARTFAVPDRGPVAAPAGPIGPAPSGR